MSWIIGLLGFGLQLAWHELGHWLVARKNGMGTPVFSIGVFWPVLFRWHWRNTEFRITPWLFLAYVQIPAMQEIGGKKPAFGVWQRCQVASAGVVMNMIMAVVLMFFMLLIYGKFEVGTTIDDLSPTVRVARDAGIQPGDTVVAVNGSPIKTGEEIQYQLMIHRHGRPVRLDIRRGDRTFSVNITPNIDGLMGVVFRDYHVVKYGVERTAILAVVDTARLFGQSAGALWFIVKSVATAAMHGKIAAEAQDIDGPVGIANALSESVRLGPKAFAYMMIVLSVGFAVFNLLVPLPVLDGGRLIFLTIEGIFGRPVPVKIQVVLSLLSLLLIIAVILCGFWNGIFHPSTAPH